jgi:hypothetical protein
VLENPVYPAVPGTVIHLELRTTNRSFADVASRGSSAGPEPHPDLPDLNFDSGAIKLNYWSTEPQAYTYDDRMQTAEKVGAVMMITRLSWGRRVAEREGVVLLRQVRELVHPRAILLLDDLEGNRHGSKMNNPVWCSYSNGARGAVLIGKHGGVEYLSEWFHASDMEASIKEVLKDRGR